MKCRWVSWKLLSIVFSLLFIQQIAWSATDSSPARPLIIGGSPAEEAPPWMVALVNYDGANFDLLDQQFCGGSLINPFWVLTAAHCVESQNAKDMRVYVRSKDNPEVFIHHEVGGIILHPKYKNGILGFEYDIALVRLTKPANVSEFVTLGNTSSQDEAGLLARAFGWGFINDDVENLQRPEGLQMGEFPILSDEEIYSIPFFLFNPVSEKMIVAGELEPAVGVNSGDSGGPLLTFDETLQEWVQVGITSWGAACEKLLTPEGVFTQVRSFRSWIEAHINTKFSDWLWQNNFDIADSIDKEDLPKLSEKFAFASNPFATEENGALHIDSLGPQGESRLSLEFRAWPKDENFSYSLQTSASPAFLEIDEASLLAEDIVEIKVFDDGSSLVSTDLETSENNLFHRIKATRIPVQSGSRLSMTAPGFVSGQTGIEKDGIEGEGINYAEILMSDLELGQKTQISVDIEGTDWNVDLIYTKTDEVLENVTSESSGTARLTIDRPYVDGAMIRIACDDCSFSARSDYLIQQKSLDINDFADGVITKSDGVYPINGFHAETFLVKDTPSDVESAVVVFQNFDATLALIDKTTLEVVNVINTFSSDFPEYSVFAGDPNRDYEARVFPTNKNETGTYLIVWFDYPEEETVTVGSSQGIAGAITNIDESTEGSGGEIVYNDVYKLNLLGQQNIEVTLEGVGNFSPYYSVFNTDTGEVIKDALSLCETNLTFERVPDVNYSLMICGSESNLGGNYLLWVDPAEAPASEMKRKFRHQLKRRLSEAEIANLMDVYREAAAIQIAHFIERRP